jgi:hypothetical protein
VCGYELLSPSSTAQFYFAESDLNGESTKTIELGPLFESTSTSGLCGITSFRLTEAVDSEVPIHPALFNFMTANDTHLTFNKYTPFISFAVLAETQNNVKGWFPIIIGLDQCGDQVVTAIESPRQVNITKNQGIASLLNSAEIAMNFNTSLDGVCPVETYDFSITPGYSVSNDSSGNLLIDSTLLLGNSSYE